MHNMLTFLVPSPLLLYHRSAPYSRATDKVVSPHYFALEDLQEDWKNLRATALSAAEQQQPPERDALRAKLKVPAEPKVKHMESL